MRHTIDQFTLSDLHGAIASPYHTDQFKDECKTELFTRETSSQIKQQVIDLQLETGLKFD